MSRDYATSAARKIELVSDVSAFVKSMTVPEINNFTALTSNIDRFNFFHNHQNEMENPWKWMGSDVKRNFNKFYAKTIILSRIAAEAYENNRENTIHNESTYSIEFNKKRKIELVSDVSASEPRQPYRPVDHIGAKTTRAGIYRSYIRLTYWSKVTQGIY